MNNLDALKRPYPDNDHDRLVCIFDILVQFDGQKLSLFDVTGQFLGWDIEENEVIRIFDLIKDSGHAETAYQGGILSVRAYNEVVLKSKTFGSYDAYKRHHDSEKAASLATQAKRDKANQVAESRKRWKETNWVWVEIFKVLITTILSTLLVLAINKIFNIK